MKKPAPILRELPIEILYAPDFVVAIVDQVQPLHCCNARVFKLRATVEKPLRIPRETSARMIQVGHDTRGEGGIVDEHDLCGATSVAERIVGFERNPARVPRGAQRT